MSKIAIEFQNEVRLRLLEESIPRIKQCMDTIQDQQLWYKPNENSNSMGNLILHLCGNVRQYLISSIGGEKDNRQRELEFTSSGKSRSELHAELDNLASQIIECIPKITQEELVRIRVVQGFKMSGLSVVVHVIEHFSYHTGQIAYMTKLFENIDLKFYGDLDLDITGS